MKYHVLHDLQQASLICSFEICSFQVSQCSRAAAACVSLLSLEFLMAPMPGAGGVQPHQMSLSELIPAVHLISLCLQIWEVPRQCRAASGDPLHNRYVFFFFFLCILLSPALSADHRCHGAISASLCRHLNDLSPSRINKSVYWCVLRVIGFQKCLGSRSRKTILP